MTAENLWKSQVRFNNLVTPENEELMKKFFLSIEKEMIDCLDSKYCAQCHALVDIDQ